MGSKSNFFIETPKGTSFYEMILFDILIVSISAKVLAVGYQKNPPQ